MATASQTHHEQQPAGGADHPHRCELLVEVMTCASCAMRIERVLSRQVGVSDARVNFATHRATVGYDPAVVDVSRLGAAVERLGYHAAAITEDSSAEEERARGREQRGWRRRAALSLPFAVAVVVLVYGFGSEDWARWSAFALTLPVQF